MSNYYDMMGVSRKATFIEIKVAWRKLAKKHHPDVSKKKNAKEIFQQLNEAYQTLSNPSSRKSYDYELDNGRSDYKEKARWSRGPQGSPGPSYTHERYYGGRHRPEVQGTWTIIKSGPFATRWGVWVDSRYRVKMGDRIVARARSGKKAWVVILHIIVRTDDYTLCYVRRV